MNILNYISPEYIFLDKVFDSKEALLEFLLDQVKNHPSILNWTLVSRDLWEREAKGGSGLEAGVAIPHARTEGVRDIVICFVRLAVPIDFGSMDGEKARFVFFILVPKEKVEEYLEVVGHIMRIMKRESVRSKLMDCRSSEEVMKLLADLEVKP